MQRLGFRGPKPYRFRPATRSKLLRPPWPHPVQRPSATPDEVAPKELEQATMIFKIQYLEGQGDLVSRFIMGIIGVTLWVMGFLTFLLSPPDPPSKDSRHVEFFILVAHLFCGLDFENDDRCMMAATDNRTRQ